MYARLYTYVPVYMYTYLVYVSIYLLCLSVMYLCKYERGCLLVYVPMFLYVCSFACVHVRL